METIRQIAERYLEGKSATTKKIIAKAVLSDYGDRYIDESFYNEIMSKLKETWQSRLIESPYQYRLMDDGRSRMYGRATGVCISIDDPQNVCLANVVYDRTVSGDGIYLYFREPTETDLTFMEVCLYYSYHFTYPQQWGAILSNSKSEWAEKIVKDARAFMEEKRDEMESLKRREADLLKEQTIENRKEEYFAIREEVLEKRKRAKEHKERHENMRKRAQSVVRSLNFLYKEILSIERESDELDEEWRERLIKWHEVVTLKAKEIAVLSISQTRAREQAEYFASLDGEWGEDKENESESESKNRIYNKPL